MNPNKHIPPQFRKTLYTCPRCKAIAEQKWDILYLTRRHEGSNGYMVDIPIDAEIAGARIWLSTCVSCKAQQVGGDKKDNESESESVWVGEKIIYPIISCAPPSHEDLPEKVREFFDEAALILPHSPRAAGALLRMAAEELCKHLECNAGSLAQSMEQVLKKINLPENEKKELKTAMETLRLAGNEASHAGQVNFDENQNVIEGMFRLINHITEVLITLPAERKNINEIVTSDKWKRPAT